MTGLGPVDMAGLVSAGFWCKIDSLAAEVLYAGLAPGAVGFYQVNVRVPRVALSSAPFTSASLVCGFNDDLQAAAPLWLK